MTAKDQKRLQIPDELIESKLYDRMVAAVGDEEARAFYQKSEDELRAIIAECEVQRTEAKQQRDENEEFKKAKAIVDIFGKGMREACKILDLKSKAASIIVAYENEVRRTK